MVRVSKVTRIGKIAVSVLIDVGSVKIQYVLDARGKLAETARWCDKQIIDSQGLIVSQVDLQKSKKMAGAILREARS